MAIDDVLFGAQTWSDHIGTQEQIKGFERGLAQQTKQVQKAIRVGLSQRDYQIALNCGLGAIGDKLSLMATNMSRGVEGLSTSLEFGFDVLAEGIDKLNADFNLMMGDVIWKLETQNHTLASILKTLQAPLDTQAKELRFRAEDAYQNGWYEESLGDFLESERKNYQDFAVHRSIGNIYLYHLIDLRKAREYFQKAAKYARPRDARQAAEAEYFAGFVCGLEHNFKDASAHMLEATALNPNFHDAFYMNAVFASMLGDATAATIYLDLAIKGDSRYHERAKTAQVFDSVRPQIDSLLDRLMRQIRNEAAQAKRSIDNLSTRCTPLLPEGQRRMSQLFSEAELQLTNARTFSDYHDFLTVPESIESQLRREEEKRAAKDRADQEHIANEHAQRLARIKGLESSIEGARLSIKSIQESQNRSKFQSFKTAGCLCILLIPIWTMIQCSIDGHNKYMNIYKGDPGPAFMTAIIVAVFVSVLALALGGSKEGKQIAEKEREIERLRSELDKMR